MSIGKNWLITHNNPKVPLEDYMDMWKDHCTYCTGQLEKGEEGTEHFQVYIALKDNKRLSGLKKLDKHAHFELSRNSKATADYCMKEDTRLQGPIEWGKRPLSVHSKPDWDIIKALAKANKLDEIDSGIYVRYYRTLVNIAKDNMEVPDRTFEKELIWIYGPPRSGKSRAARVGPHYPKLANKWWDGYKPDKHTAVVMDDLGKDKARALTDHIKLWADPWQNQIGETKGGAIPLIFDKLTITSNYHPDECFEGIDLEAVKSRFKIIHMGLPVVHTQ